MAPPEVIDLRPGLPAIEAAPNLAAVFLAWAREGAPYLGRTAVLRRRLRRLAGVAERIREN